ncbi:rho GTPase-activating protein 17 isoform X1 [Petromyzon marinus]|uniref:rho GTPase-activating protein 17 isoform X1 n=1 Tax=Petromyzon marinus TaxID=7757 RepID=UPI003F71C4D2
MKKQFNRMRQLASQTVGRAEKTEVLSEDLLQVEKRLDQVKAVSHSTHKKLLACLQGQVQGDYEKRIRKLPQSALSQCLIEGAATLGDDSLLGKMLELCGDAENRLAVELTVHEMQVEREVLEPLFNLAEVEIPNIQKQRKHLAKLVLDMDSARARWQQATKSGAPGTNLQTLAAKADSLREEMEEAINKVEMCKDQLATDLYNFMAKEGEYAKFFAALIEAQAEYHRKSLSALEKILPALKIQQDKWTEKPSFGVALEEHLQVSGREIAFPIECCVTMLLESGMQEEGLFRIAPAASRLKKLKAALDCGAVETQEYASDPHATAGALKSYLRELPEPLMTFSLYEEWIQASNSQDPDKRLQALKNVCNQLPKANYDNLRYLVKFFSKLSEHQDENKMTASNMAIVLGPNMLWSPNEASMTDMMTTVSLHTGGIIEPIIQNANWFFPGELDFGVTANSGASSPTQTNHNANHEIPATIAGVTTPVVGSVGSVGSMGSVGSVGSGGPPEGAGGTGGGSPETELKEPRPHSIATDNVSMEFRKDGLRKIQSMGVRVMDTDWMARRGGPMGSGSSLSGGGAGPHGFSGSVRRAASTSGGEQSPGADATPLESPLSPGPPLPPAAGAGAAPPAPPVPPMPPVPPVPPSTPPVAPGVASPSAATVAPATPSAPTPPVVPRHHAEEAGEHWLQSRRLAFHCPPSSSSSSFSSSSLEERPPPTTSSFHPTKPPVADGLFGGSSTLPTSPQKRAALGHCAPPSLQIHHHHQHPQQPHPQQPHPQHHHPLQHHLQHHPLQLQQQQQQQQQQQLHQQQQHYDINYNPRPTYIAIPKQPSPSDTHVPEPGTAPPVYMKTPLLLTKRATLGGQTSGTLGPTGGGSSSSGRTVGCGCAREGRPGLYSTLRSSGKDGAMQKSCTLPAHAGSGLAQLSIGANQTLSGPSPGLGRRASKKPAPPPPKPPVKPPSLPAAEPGSEPPTSSASTSRSSTPPSTPPTKAAHPTPPKPPPLSPADPDGESSGRMTLSRPTPRPRQRPSVPPPPQPPGLHPGSATAPQDFKSPTTPGSEQPILNHRPSMSTSACQPTAHGAATADGLDGQRCPEAAPCTQPSNGHAKHFDAESTAF